MMEEGVCAGELLLPPVAVRVQVVHLRSQDGHDLVRLGSTVEGYGPSHVDEFLELGCWQGKGSLHRDRPGDESLDRHCRFHGSSRVLIVIEALVLLYVAAVSLL